MTVKRDYVCMCVCDQLLIVIECCIISTTTVMCITVYKMEQLYIDFVYCTINTIFLKQCASLIANEGRVGVKLALN